MDQIARRVRVTGRVQGVSFRVWSKREAERLGLRGWVRNEADGSVSALIAGPDGSVHAMLDRLRVGPRGAAVSSVEVAPASPADAPTGFRITG